MLYKIVGIGNPLMGDDAFGLFVIEELKKLSLQDRAILISLPTPSPWDIYEVLAGGGFFIIVDVFENGEEGVVESFPISEIASKNSKFKTVHDININQVLDLLRLKDINIEGLVVGTKGYNFSISLELSEKLKKMITPCLSKIESLIN